MSQEELSISCRCCLRGSSKNISLFRRHGSLTYADMIRECCSLEVATSDEMPSHICIKCSSKLKSFCKFRKMCLKINNILLKNLPSYSLKLDSIKSEDANENAVLKPEIPSLNTFNSDSNDVILDEIKSEPYETYIEENSNSNDESYIPDGPMDPTVLEFTETESKVVKMESMKTENCVEEEDFLLELMKKASAGKTSAVLQSDLNYSCKIFKDNLESQPINAIPAKAKMPKKYLCLLCKRDCKNGQRLVDHMNWFHKGIKYYCELCKKSYTSKQSHIRNVHSKGQKCAICGLICENKSKYYAHIQNKHRKGSPQRCTECPTVCSSKASFDRHMKAVHGETKFICQYCSRTFKRKDKLNDHIKTHTKEKPFACDVCPYRFPTKHTLNRHRQRHTAQKTIKCDQCESMFRTKEDLRQHITRHDASFKRYACAVCGKRFRRSDHRNTHQTNVHKLDSTHDGDKTERKQRLIDGQLTGLLRTKSRS